MPPGDIRWQAINDVLDKADLISGEYFLEVSSPGIERVLRKDSQLDANVRKWYWG